MGKISEALEKNKSGQKRVLSEKKTKRTVSSVRRLPEKVPDDATPETSQEIVSADIKISSKLISYLKPASFEAEQIKLLKTNILFPGSGSPPPRTVMVVSAMPGEGKSFLAANLGVSIAQDINRHVLLIDCDIRRPTLHQYFGLPRQKGLSDYLLNRSPLAPLINATGIEKLSLIPGGGAPPPNPSELIASAQMAAMIKEVKARYRDRIIIIDSPPPLLASEANVVAQQVDGIIIVVKAGKTSRVVIKELVSQIGKSAVLGVFLNWFNMRFAPYDSKKAYGSYQNH